MSLDEAALASLLRNRCGCEVVIAPPSIDEALGLLHGTARRVVLAISPGAPMIAALAAGVRLSAATVLVGTFDELSRQGPTMAVAIGPGRLVFAREWAIDSSAALFGRRGAALTESREGTPPRVLGENPVAPSEHVGAAVRRAAETVDLRRYPPVSAIRLEEAIARRLGYDPSWIVASGAGSIELLQRSLHAFADEGDEVVARAPTFDALPNLCAQAGVGLRYVEDLVASGSARIVYLASPNNPDGREATPEEIAAIRQALPADRLLLLDETHRGFAPGRELFPHEPGVPTDGAAPVVSFRSFSKLDGAAGLRVGFVLAPPALAELLRRFGVPHALNAIVEEGALAALEDDAHREAVRREVAESRNLLAQCLAALGFEVAASRTHVIFARPPAGRLERLLLAAEREGLPIEESAQAPGHLLIGVVARAGVEDLVERIRAALGQTV